MRVHGASDDGCCRDFLITMMPRQDKTKPFHHSSAGKTANPPDIYRCELLIKKNKNKKMPRCFHPENSMNGIEERAGCQATSVKTGRCRWKYFILLTSEERVVQSQSKEVLGKKIHICSGL